jgi:hypothetical protein
VERRQVAQLSTAVTLLAAIAASGYLVASSLEVRYERDVSRMVFNDNVELLDDLRRRAGLEIDSLSEFVPRGQYRRPPLVVPEGRFRPVHDAGGYRERQDPRVFWLRVAVAL